MELRIRDIPEDLHERFKILCIREKISMNKAIIELMQHAVDADERQRQK